MSFIFYAILSAISFAFTILVVKYISKHIVKDFSSFFFWTYIAGLPFAFVMMYLNGFYFNFAVVVWMALSSFFLVLGQYMFTKGVFLVDASTIGPLFQLQSGFVVILATLFLGEVFPKQIYFYIVLLILGAMLVSVTDKLKISGFAQKGNLYIILMQVLHAAANIFVGFALKTTNSVTTLFYSFLFSSVYVSLFTLIKKDRIDYKPKTIVWMLFRAGLLFTSTGLLYKAFETNVSISATLGLLSSPLIFIIAVIASVITPNLLEKQSAKTYIIRSIGLIIILLAAFNISALKYM